MIIYYFVTLATFFVGLLGLLLKKDLVSSMICLQVLFSSLNLFFMILSKSHLNHDGGVFVFFSLLLSVVIMMVGIFLMTLNFRKKNILFFDELSSKD